MCGLCLPHCPTYVETSIETESPRGRIALIQGLADGRLAPTLEARTYLDHCLVCRACEHVCPSGVRYGQLIDGARELLGRGTPKLLRERFLGWLAMDIVIGRTSLLRLGGGALRLYQRSGLQWLLRKTGMLRAIGAARMDGLLPRLHRRHSWRSYYPPHGEERGRVALFTGCIADIADQQTSTAAVTVLTKLGYGVYVPADQVCCGALHLHSGAAAKARALAQRNLKAFGQVPVETIVFTASGCGAMLAEYGALLEHDGSETQPGGEFADKATDICQFLADTPWPEGVQPRPLAKTVAVHDPCSLTHVLRQQDKPYAVLGKIPGIKLLPLPDNARCCGAAGTYMLSQRDMADRLRDKKLALLDSLGADLLVSSNIGCVLHLTHGLQQAGRELEMMHPVVLLERQLG